MDEFGDKLNAILNDPGALSRITDMAKSIMGGEQNRESAPRAADTDLSIDPDMLGRIASMMKKSGGRSEERALLEAMKPYLSEKRRAKMDKALKLAKLAGLAEIAAAEFGLGKGADGDV